MNSLKC